jgi:hypothetical protein
MKKIFIQSFNDLHERRKITEPHKLPKIAVLFLFDLNENSLYYLTHHHGLLKDNKEYSLDYENNFVNNCLKESLPISEEYFNELINIKCKSFFIMNKNDLLLKLGFEEFVI